MWGDEALGNHGGLLSAESLQTMREWPVNMQDWFLHSFIELSMLLKPLINILNAPLSGGSMTLHARTVHF